MHICSEAVTNSTELQQWETPEVQVRWSSCTHPNATGEHDEAVVMQPLGRDVAAVRAVHADHGLAGRLELLDEALHSPLTRSACFTRNGTPINRRANMRRNKCT